ncbi:E3 ubiquitin-protein ligase RNF169 isoform X2 [Scleropages formosus]|uniref:E3 ubiquitin-protein ligase RNF169 isoform X2 n=1 Tax=Scleropages formosus TaxID=113540 RepID=UPI0010FA6CBB|nr:E3 ubiquitin-protein ligase RNF169 isoform X2 [Scleropages formosus]
MAAVSSAKSAGAAPGKTERHRGRGGPMEGAASAARLLTQEEARCPVCSEIFLEPVTMPCRHSVCLPCFRRTVEQSALRCCPLCRLRVSGWARRQSREKSLVNAELWDMVRRSYPERCERRMEQEKAEAVGGGVIFRAPVHICKPGEIQQEYEKKKKKGEKEKGEKASGQAIQKILEGDWRQVDGERQKKTFLRYMSEEKRRVQLHHIEEEGGIPKYFQDSHGVLSDSENEEPIGKRTRHVSAFVRKTRNSPASSRILQNHAVQRSRSCTDTEEDRRKNSCPLQLNIAPKTYIAYSHNAGILLSSENSRSLSAPVLFPDKKHPWRSVSATANTFVAPQAKPERSISPESNDSISEELNHFKPIVCSPCTPPKRLPDGRVLEPTIVKSTPRNLSRSLQKPTSYEASPTILQKWKQIEIDRQVTSKGTITSPFTEDFTQGQSPGEKGKISETSLEKNVLKDCLTVSTPKIDTSGHEIVKTCNKRRLIFDRLTGESSISVTQVNKTCTPIVDHCTCIAGDSLQGVEIASIAYSGPISTLADKKDVEVAVCNQKLTDVLDKSTVSNPRNSIKSTPTSRKGRKRSQKTKHLEEARAPKKPKSLDEDSLVTETDENSFLERRVQQEKEDHKLALKLQRQFNKECQKVDRRKISPERYLLRSWVSTDCHSEYNPRRSGRTSKKKEHFN